MNKRNLQAIQSIYQPQADSGNTMIQLNKYHFKQLLEAAEALQEKERIEGYLKTIQKHFYDAYINYNNELIVEPENNIYLVLKNASSDLAFKCQVLAWLSRPSCKGIGTMWQKKILALVNDLLGTSFTKEEIQLVYGKLGNNINPDLSIAFIESGYDMKLIKEAYTSCQTF